MAEPYIRLERRCSCSRLVPPPEVHGREHFDCPCGACYRSEPYTKGGWQYVGRSVGRTLRSGQDDLAQLERWDRIEAKLDQLLSRGG